MVKSSKGGTLQIKVTAIAEGRQSDPPTLCYSNAGSGDCVWPAGPGRGKAAWIGREDPRDGPRYSPDPDQSPEFTAWLGSHPH